MIDPDAPAPRTESRRHLPGSAGPWLHAVWTDCRGGSTRGPPLTSSPPSPRPVDTPGREKEEDDGGGAAERSKAAVPYNGPSPPAGAHRYILVLFEQTGDGGTGTGRNTVVERSADRSAASSRKRWDFRQFLVDNPHLKPKAVNFFYCSREKGHDA